MRRLPAWLSIASLLFFATAAHAGTAATTATLGIAIRGIAPMTFSGSGNVTVAGSTVFVPAGLVTLSAKIVVPVTSTTSLFAVRLNKGVSNLAATFRPGGITTQLPSEICPGSGPSPLGNACNVGGAIGGVMGLTGTMLWITGPGLGGITIPMNLNAALLGKGGSTNLPFDIDAAGWTTGSGLLSTANNASFVFNGAGSPLTLVSPTFIQSLLHVLTPSFPHLPQTSLVATLTLQGVSLPVPEPSSLLLIATGVAGLVLLARRR